MPADEFFAGARNFICRFKENYRMGGSYTWPTLKEVRDYRREVKDAILQIIDSVELVLPVAFDSPLVSDNASDII